MGGLCSNVDILDVDRDRCSLVDIWAKRTVLSLYFVSQLVFIVQPRARAYAHIRMYSLYVQPGQQNYFVTQIVMGLDQPKPQE